MRRDKRIEIRLSGAELYQIKKYFGKENIGTYVRNHLLEISSECAIDTTNEADIFAMFQMYLSEDETAREIFNKFIDKMHLGELVDLEEEEEEDYDEWTWYMGKKIKYSQLKELEEEYNKK